MADTVLECRIQGRLCPLSPALGLQCADSKSPRSAGAPDGRPSARSEIPRARLCPMQQSSAPPYAVLHAGAAYETKRWEFDRFLAVAAELRHRHNLEPVFVAGPAEGDVAARTKEFPLRQGLPLQRLMELLAGARLFVGNDSGPGHVAAAYGVPCVSIFGSSHSSAWHPWKTPHRVVETAWSCKPCPGDRCYEYDEPRCILSVETGAVSRAVSDLLEEVGRLR